MSYEPAHTTIAATKAHRDSGGDTNRTCISSVKSRVLYQLSYATQTQPLTNNTFDLWSGLVPNRTG